jgi:hypothetical protein
LEEKLDLFSEKLDENNEKFEKITKIISLLQNFAET